MIVKKTAGNIKDHRPELRVKYFSNLARVGLKETERVALERELRIILDYVRKIRTHRLPQSSSDRQSYFSNSFRDDVRYHNSRLVEGVSLINQATDQHRGYVRVPSVFSR